MMFSPPAVFSKAQRRALTLLLLCASLNGCLGMAVGAVAGTAVGVGVAVDKVPVKAVGKAAGATLGLVLPDGENGVQRKVFE